MVKPTPLQPRRTASATDPVMAWLGASRRGPAVRRVQFQNGRNLTGKLVGTGLDHSQRRGISRQPGINGDLKMIERIISVRVDRKASRRSVLESLVDRQNDHFTGTAKPTLHQHAGEVGFHAGAVRPVIVEDGLNLAGDLHGVLWCLLRCNEYRPTSAAMSPIVAVCRQPSRRGVIQHL